jgi:8-oxo-dGTP pyrophosphatase MutT (NUDIX family)
VTEFDPIPDLAHARAMIEAYAPPNGEQVAQRERILAFLDDHPRDAHRRTCLSGHLTCSALLIDHEGRRALLTLHRKLGRWLQIGGHCDGDANLRAVVRRELIEESGIEAAWISAEPVDLDVHVIPARPGEPEHLHLDVRFGAWAPAGASERISAESIELAWFEPSEARGLELDESVRRLFRQAFA